jgi:UDP-2-acetamido-3-amino-2,3-dideoxy-glucuronate N-acetyltransferase
MKEGIFVHESAALADDVNIGFNTIIESDVIIGKNVQIGHNVVIHHGTVVGDNVTIQDGVNLGKSNFETLGTGSSKKMLEGFLPLEIESNVLIATGALCYAGTKIGFGSIIADHAIVREGCDIGHNVKIGKKAIIEYEVVLEEGVSIQAFVLVGEKMRVGEGAFMGPHVSTACDTNMSSTSEEELDIPSIGPGVKVGVNTTILPGIEIGKNSIIGGGSVVSRNIMENVVALGSPAKPVRRLRE